MSSTTDTMPTYSPLQMTTPGVSENSYMAGYGSNFFSNMPSYYGMGTADASTWSSGNPPGVSVFGNYGQMADGYNSSNLFSTGYYSQSPFTWEMFTPQPNDHSNFGGPRTSADPNRRAAAASMANTAAASYMTTNDYYTRPAGPAGDGGQSMPPEYYVNGTIDMERDMLAVQQGMESLGYAGGDSLGGVIGGGMPDHHSKVKTWANIASAPAKPPKKMIGQAAPMMNHNGSGGLGGARTVDSRPGLGPSSVAGGPAPWDNKSGAGGGGPPLMGSSGQQRLGGGFGVQRSAQSKPNAFVKPYSVSSASAGAGAGSTDGSGSLGGGGCVGGSAATHPVLEKLKESNQYNPKKLLPSDGARFFVIKSYSEDDIHRSIKYSIWCSTEHGNKRLDAAYSEREGKGPVYLFFSVNGSGHFCGVAEMQSALDYESTSDVWQLGGKWKGKFSVKWIYVKDVPNAQLRHIRLENNENKPVTNSRDTQEVPSDKGKRVLEVIHTYKHTTSIFDDFSHYERKQEEDSGSSADKKLQK